MTRHARLYNPPKIKPKIAPVNPRAKHSSGQAFFPEEGELDERHIKKVDSWKAGLFYVRKNKQVEWVERVRKERLMLCRRVVLMQFIWAACSHLCSS